MGTYKTVYDLLNYLFIDRRLTPEEFARRLKGTLVGFTATSHKFAYANNIIVLSGFINFIKDNYDKLSFTNVNFIESGLCRFEFNDNNCSITIRNMGQDFEITVWNYRYSNTTTVDINHQHIETLDVHEGMQGFIISKLCEHLIRLLTLAYTRRYTSNVW